MSERFKRSDAYIDKSVPPGASRETRCVRGNYWQCKMTGAVVPPIHVSTTFARDESYEKVNDRGYARDDNPVFEQAESLLCELEGAYDACLFSSGMAACAAPLQVLDSGSHIVMQENIYFGLPLWVREYLSRAHGVSCAFIPSGDLHALASVCSARAPSLVWVETPANPALDITDIGAAADIAHKAGAYLVVDSTVATPVHSRPLLLGADFVVHSATKSLNGHSDLLAGFVASREDGDFWRSILRHRYLTGCLLGSFEAYLLLRGMRTLFLRVRRQSASALRIAEVLRDEFSDRLDVCYPGLPSHAGYAVACSQMEGGFGSLMALLFKGGEDEIRLFLSRLRLVKRATSLGGVESLIEHRKTIEGEDSSVADNLLRFSVGIEDVEDILSDLRSALSGS